MVQHPQDPSNDNALAITPARHGVVEKAIARFNITLEEVVTGVEACNNGFNAKDDEPGQNPSWDKIAERAAKCFWRLPFNEAHCLKYFKYDEEDINHPIGVYNSAYFALDGDTSAPNMNYCKDSFDG